MAAKMVSIRIENFNHTNIDILHELWKEILSIDSQWHFFWEGPYTVLRISRTFSQVVKDFLEDKGIEYIDQGEWIDNIPITAEFQREFRNIFHGYSEIAMKNIDSSENKIKLLFDRVAHCFLNNITTVERRGDSPATWESKMLIDNAIDRAITIGRILGR